MKIYFFIFLLFSAHESFARDGAFLSPQNDGWVVHAHIPVAFSCAVSPLIMVNDENIVMKKTPFPHLWYGQAPGLPVGRQAVAIEGKCRKKIIKRVFTLNFFATTDVTPAKLLAQNFMHKHPAQKLKWDWGDALFLYGLGRLSDEVSYGLDYQTHYFFHPVTIDWADRCPSALSALALWRKTGHPESYQNLMRTLEFIKHGPKNSLGAINHFGEETWMSKIFPASIWVDSLMMYALLAVEAGVELGQPDLLEFGLSQQIIFAQKMKDLSTGAYYHAWSINKDRPFPKSNTFWLRGNGWVGASLVLMLEKLDDRKITHPLVPKLKLLAQTLAASVRKFMPEHFVFDTLLTRPGKGYEELSGSALMALFFVKGAQLKILVPEYYQIGFDIYGAITARLRPGKNGLSMPDISGPTMPYPELGYRIVPRGRDYSYGLGAYLLLAQAVQEGSAK
ncbi:MAG: hypothetical protein A2X86_16235 [Bdellovibrionales bacterium GWA2_49_15]|nr:MAG: hypothetical protein A2X86_16235 [Bdellovibrionales bacterium GWA2_49_15]HAZ13655.1 hypothetical protein [Bdellovibrionales bacterium]